MRANLLTSGDYIDYWSIPHFLSGVIGGLVVLLYFEGTLLTSLLVVIAAAILWELVEYGLKVTIKAIKEPLSNAIVDVVLAVAGFLITYLTLEDLGEGSLATLLIFIVAAHIALNTTGLVLGLLHQRKGR